MSDPQRYVWLIFDYQTGRRLNIVDSQEKADHEITRRPMNENESQFCPACPTDGLVFGREGRWVDVAGHKHPLPRLRPSVYLSDTTPGAHLYNASLAVLVGNEWLGAREFPTMAEAMDYAATVLAPLAEQRWPQ